MRAKKLGGFGKGIMGDKHSLSWAGKKIKGGGGGRLSRKRNEIRRGLKHLSPTQICR